LELKEGLKRRDPTQVTEKKGAIDRCVAEKVGDGEENLEGAVRVGGPNPAAVLVGIVSAPTADIRWSMK
jgi:hypothetical protein